MTTEYLIPIDIALPDFLLQIEVENGDREPAKFEDMEIYEQNEYMVKSDNLIKKLKPYLK